MTPLARPQTQGRCRDLLLELTDADRDASRLPRREAERLGDVPPARALRAVAAHADETLAVLAAIGRARGIRPSAIGEAADVALALVRHLVRERGGDAAHGYRGALLGLRRGMDVTRALRAAAGEEADGALVDFCDGWLSVRLRLVAGVEAELAWFGRARGGADNLRARVVRALVLVTAGAVSLTVADAACTDGAAGEPGAASIPDAAVPTPAEPGAGAVPRSLADACPRAGDRSCPTGAANDGKEAGDAAPPPYVHVDINHVLSTGQSNSVANDGKPVFSTTQPYANLMFDVGVMTASDCDSDGCRRYDTPSAFAPLVEGDTFFSPVETMSSSLANTVTRLARAGALAGTGEASHDVLVTLHGRSGNSYWCLRKGGCPWWDTRGYVRPWEDGMKQVADAKRLADAAGRTYAVRAVTAIHGEHDHYAWSSGASLFPLPRTDGRGTLADYGEALLEWQRDYEAGVKEITGQTISPPLLVSQYSHWNDVPTTVIAYQQLRAHVTSAGKVVVVGPTYALPYSSTCLHFTGDGERWLGEYFGKAYARIVLERRPWEPLRPVAITRVAATITVRYAVPAPPLVLDTESVKDPGDRGFEVVDAAGARLRVSSVTVTGPDTVTLTLDGTGAPPARVRYAYTFTGCSGSGTIARGNLRDSDPTPSASGHPLWNWSVHFDEPIP
jgi:hypothetical protein